VAAVGLGASASRCFGRARVIRCRFEIKRRNQKPATRIVIPIRKGISEGREFSDRRATGARGAFGAGRVLQIGISIDREVAGSFKSIEIGRNINLEKFAVDLQEAPWRRPDWESSKNRPLRSRPGATV
jgi:hypothetical protein